jgi:membrane protease YdiL (CAAX protease family)
VTQTRPTVPPPPLATERRQPVPWTLVDLFMVAVLTLFLIAPLVSAASRAWLPPDAARAVSVPALMFAFAATTIGWTAARYHGQVVHLFGNARAGLRDALAGVGHGVVAFFGLNLLLGLLFVFVTELVGIEVAPVQQRIRDFADEPAMVPFLLVSVVIAAPLAEELFFRGMLFQWLRARVPLWLAVASSALVFGIAHWEADNMAGAIYMVVSLSAVGAYLAWVFHRRGTIVAPITMHATFNLLAAVWILQGIG